MYFIVRLNLNLDSQLLSVYLLVRRREIRFDNRYCNGQQSNESKLTRPILFYFNDNDLFTQYNQIVLSMMSCSMMDGGKWNSNVSTVVVCNAVSKIDIDRAPIISFADAYLSQ